MSLDFLGTGQSDRLEEWPTNWWKEGADQVQALVQHLQYKNAILMGTSGGAVIALLTAILYPDTVEAVIADSFVETFTTDMFSNNIQKERSQKTEQKIQFWKFAHGEDWEEVIDADTEMMKQFTKQGGRWLERRINEIHCPVLMTASKEDNMLPDIEKQLCQMSKKIEKSKVFLNDKGMHPFMWSQSDSFKAITDYFLNTL